MWNSRLSFAVCLGRDLRFEVTGLLGGWGEREIFLETGKEMKPRGCGWRSTLGPIERIFNPFLIVLVIQV